MFQGDGRPTLRPIRERPTWVDDPPYIDDSDTRLLYQIPPDLIPNFVALADEMDRRGEDEQAFRLEEYMEFRGWKDKILQTATESNGGALDGRHVWAAQKCWRAIKSADIREAEARGIVIFPRNQLPTLDEVPSSMPEETTIGVIDSRGVANPDTCTSPQQTKTVASESPEFSVQAAPPKRKDNIDTIDSPGPTVVPHQNRYQHQQRQPQTKNQNQQRDEIQSPGRMFMEDQPEDPIEENSEPDEIQIIGVSMDG